MFIKIKQKVVFVNIKRIERRFVGDLFIVFPTVNYPAFAIPLNPCHPAQDARTNNHYSAAGVVLECIETIN